MTCRSKSGPTDISPVNGRLWEAISTTQTGASGANPIATAHVRVTLPFNTLFPYPFVPHDGWTLAADATYSVVRNR